MIRKRLGSASLEVVPLEHSGHVATLDADAQEIFDASERFFQVHARSNVSTEKQ